MLFDRRPVAKNRDAEAGIIACGLSFIVRSHSKHGSRAGRLDLRSGVRGGFSRNRVGRVRRTDSRSLGEMGHKSLTHAAQRRRPGRF